LIQKYIKIVDKWIFADNSEEKFKTIAEGAKDELIIKDQVLWDELHKKYK